MVMNHYWNGEEKIKIKYVVEYNLDDAFNNRKDKEQIGKNQ
jgi:hypothetical protein